MQEYVQALRKRIGRNVKRLRESRGWSQAKLAELVGNTEKHIGQIERGEVNTGVNTLAAIAYRCAVNVTDLFAEPADARRRRAGTFSKEELAQFDELARVVETLRAARARQSRRSR
jgi:transcriptional regulator with XRE-family HTH domain